ILSLWLGDINTLVRPEELDVPLHHHTACYIGQYDVVNVDRKNIGGWTPLMYGNATTGKGLTPLMLAASCGNENPAYFLMQVRFTSLNQIFSCWPIMPM
uniref:Uncharacterized protein n=1 Tax=Salmo trutta TaxID=8032 RepID=A0A673XXE2_SALTR